MLGSGLESDLADPAEVLAGTDHNCRLGVADEVLNLRLLIGLIERQINKPGAQRGQVQQHGLNRFFHLHRDACTGWQLQRIKQRGQHGAGTLKVAPGIKQTVIGFDGDAVQVLREAGAQRDEEIAVGRSWGIAVLHVREGTDGDLNWPNRPWRSS